jgi:hypothetical protein
LEQIRPHPLRIRWVKTNREGNQRPKRRGAGEGLRGLKDQRTMIDQTRAVLNRGKEAQTSKGTETILGLSQILIISGKLSRQKM